MTSVDAGIIDLMLVIMNGLVADGLTALQPLVTLFLAFSLLLACATALMVYFGHESLMLMWTMLKFMLGWTLIAGAMANWVFLTNALLNTAAAAGLSIAGHQLTVDQFLAPGTMAVAGASITNKTQEYLNTLGWTAIYKPHQILAMSLMTTITGVVWVLLAMHQVVSIFLFRFLSLFGFLGLAFLLAPALRWFGASLVRLTISSTMQIFALAAWSSVLVVLIPKIITLQVAEPSLWRITLAMGISIFLFCMTIGIPLVAALGAFSATGMVLARPLRAAQRMATGRIL